MNTKNNIMIVADNSHPNIDLIKSKFKVKTMDEAIASYDTYDIVIDLTILKTNKKLLFLKELARTTRAQIISDLTCTFQEKIFHKIPQVKASISSFFYSPTNTIEYFINPNSESHIKTAINEIIVDLFSDLGFKTYETKTLEITFTVPRVVSQIINEAYFALEENLATEHAIDQAMISGVNYPLGPITWAKKCGLRNILSILEELYKTTGDARYRPSLKLKKECL